MRALRAARCGYVSVFKGDRRDATGRWSVYLYRIFVVQVGSHAFQPLMALERFQSCSCSVFHDHMSFFFLRLSISIYVTTISLSFNLSSMPDRSLLAPYYDIPSGRNRCLERLLSLEMKKHLKWLTFGAIKKGWPHYTDSVYKSGSEERWTNLQVHGLGNMLYQRSA